MIKAEKTMIELCVLSNDAVANFMINKMFERFPASVNRLVTYELEFDPRGCRVCYNNRDGYIKDAGYFSYLKDFCTYFVDGWKACQKASVQAAEQLFLI